MEKKYSSRKGMLVPGWLLSGIAVILLSLFYMFFYRFSFPADADSAFYMRTAAAMKTAGPLLKGWYGGFYNPWSSDFLWVGLMRLFLSEKILLFSLGPLAYSLMLLSVFFLMRGRDGKLSVTVCLLSPLLLIPQVFENSMLSVGIHVISLFYLTLLLLWIQNFTLTGWHGLGFVLFLTFCSLNDSWTVYFFAFPLICVLLIEYLLVRDRKTLRLALLTGLACGLSMLILRLLTNAGAIEVSSFAPQFYALNELPSGFLKLFGTLSNAFGIGISKDLNLPMQIVRSLCGIGLLAAIACSIIFLLIKWRNFDLAAKTCAFSAIFTLGVYTLTKLDTDAIHYHYIFPFLVTGIALLGKVTMKIEKRKLLSGTVLALSTLFSVLNTAPKFSSAPQEDAALKETAAFLMEKNIRQIYTPYWESHTLWYYSHGQIEAASVVADENGAIKAHRWASNTAWYEPDFECRCIMLAQDAYIYRLDLETIKAQFGEPMWHQKAGTANIYCYDKNLSELLAD